MKVSYGRIEKKNTGNYENITFEIRAEDYIITECEDDVACYNRLKEFVDAQMIELTSTCGDTQFPPVNHSDILDKIRASIAKLIGFDQNNRKVISDALAAFGLNKITQLDDLQARELDIKLQRLLR